MWTFGLRSSERRLSSTPFSLLSDPPILGQHHSRVWSTVWYAWRSGRRASNDLDAGCVAVLGDAYADVMEVAY